jgi:hypothetical protein
MRSFALVCLLLCASPVGAQAPDWLSRVSVHGYLSQAYAVSEDHQIFGIPTDGTTDYRDLALQLRYDQNPKDSFVLQVRQQRLGDSPRASEDIELDWAFYQRRFSDRFALKAGRIPLPLGIFNEAGGAATTSPFFRPPNELYERQYTSKTLDGFLGTAAVGGARGWDFEVDGYAGQWALDYYDSGQRVDAREAWGAQVWANSPLPGVRVGGGAYRCTVEPPSGESADYLMVHGSAEADLERWRLAAEYLSGNLAEYGRYRAWYGQAGYQFTDRFSVHARGAVAEMRLPVNGHTMNARLSEDLGLSLNFAIQPSLLLKLEGHTNEGLLREDQPRDLYADPSTTRYLIVSLVASF